MRPTTTPVSALVLASVPSRAGVAAAIASGKLAPQSTAAGSIVNNARARSIWKLNHADASDGSTGQYGSCCAAIHAPYAIVNARENWTQPSVVRALEVFRTTADPIALPMPSPTRNTATMMENAYVVAPN